MCILPAYSVLTHSPKHPILPPTHSPNLPILPTNPFSHSQPLNAPVVDDSEEEEDGINLIVEDALHPSVDAKKSLQPDVIAPSNGAKERKKFPWVQDWGSPNGPMWWWCQGDPTIQWGEAQKKDMKAALFKALGAAKMTRSKSNFKGAHPFSQLLPTHPPTTHSPGHIHSPMTILPNNPFSHPTHPPILPATGPAIDATRWDCCLPTCHLAISGFASKAPGSNIAHHNGLWIGATKLMLQSI